ncbi:hypothetical protein, partial [Escherichia coli]|uniref:hypothetical protein n=1 Tax=Escherichia coli TaxID=562 RepID=UPI001F34003A
TVHEEKVKRRRRDNWIGGIAVIVIVALAIGTQLLFFAKPSATSASASPSPSASTAAGVPSKSIAEGRTWTGDMTINGIKLGVSLDGAAAP